MILYVARHGETDLNIEDRFQGISDLPLNVRGREQASILADSLPAGIVHVFTSPQLRAYQTASAVAQARRLPLTTMPYFRERDFGIFEGLTPAEAEQHHPVLWAQDIVRQWNSAPPGGETTRNVVRRIATGLRTLRRQHRDEAVVLIAHGFVVRAVRYLLTGIPQEEFFAVPKIGNGEFLTFVLP
jgi:broad specificity phosphatase PhoE